MDQRDSVASHACTDRSRPALRTEHMGSSQNYGPILVPLKIRSGNINIVSMKGAHSFEHDLYIGKVVEVYFD